MAVRSYATLLISYPTRTIHCLTLFPYIIDNLALMRVAMVLVRGAAGHFFHGDDAAFELLAAGVLELNGGVTDLEAVTEHLVELEQDAGAR